MTDGSRHGHIHDDLTQVPTEVQRATLMYAYHGENSQSTLW